MDEFATTSPDKQAENRDASGRFRKGCTGNAKGRPKGRTLMEAIRAELAKRGESGKGLKLDEAAKAYVDAMIGGSFQHAKEVIEREDGTVPEDVRVEIIWRKPGQANADSAN